MKSYSFILFVCAVFVGSVSYAQETSSPFDAVIHADGQSHEAWLAGDDGGRGSDGSDGNSPFCFHDDPAKDGEDGRDGERGHSGDDGGDTLIYVSKLEYLKNVFIDASPGYGGPGGRGGRGGRGCNGGRDGRDGYDGSMGSRGSYGTVYLFPEGQRYQSPILETSSTVLELLEKPFSLGKNVWEEGTGMSRLLMPRSQVSSQYYSFKGRSQWTVSAKWVGRDDPKKIFQNDAIYAFVSDSDNEPSVRFSYQAIAIYDVEKRPGELILNIRDYLRADDLFVIDWSLKGNFAKRELVIKEKRRLPSSIKTSFAITVYEKVLGWDGKLHRQDVRRRYPVAAKYVKTSGGAYTIDLTALKNELKAYRNLFIPRYLEIQIRRTFSDDTVEKSYDLAEKL